MVFTIYGEFTVQGGKKRQQDSAEMPIALKVKALLVLFWGLSHGLLSRWPLDEKEGLRRDKSAPITELYCTVLWSLLHECPAIPSSGMHRTFILSFDGMNVGKHKQKNVFFTPRQWMLNGLPEAPPKGGEGENCEKACEKLLIGTPYRQNFLSEGGLNERGKN